MGFQATPDYHYIQDFNVSLFFLRIYFVDGECEWFVRRISVDRSSQYKK